MNYLDFEKELKAIDERFEIRQNPYRRAGNGNTMGICNIFYCGKEYDLPPIPEEIKDLPDVGYYYTFPNGMSARFWSKQDVMPRVEKFLKDYKDGVYEGLYD